MGVAQKWVDLSSVTVLLCICLQSVQLPTCSALLIALGAAVSGLLSTILHKLHPVTLESLAHIHRRDGQWNTYEA